MTITYAGVPLLLEDPEGTVRRWLNRHLSERHASIFCMGNTAVNDLRHASIKQAQTVMDTCVPRVSLPCGNYPALPRMKINSLIHPTGAKRWTQGLFLIDGSGLTTILNAIPNGESAVLALSDGQNSVSLRLRLLPPRPISPPGTDANTRLWMLPLVDERYYWQMWYVGEYAPLTWTEALSQIGADAPTFTTAVPANLGDPFPSEWKRPHEQAAMMIDAVALSTMRRVIRMDNEANAVFSPYRVVSATESESRLNANFGESWGVVAGGDFSDQLRAAARPESVGVSYPFPQAEGVYDGEWNVMAYNSPVPFQSGRYYYYHCSSDDQSQVYADAVAVEHLLWMDRHYDITYAGIVPWRQTGYDDYVSWEFNRQRRGSYVAQTRAVSMPPSFGIDGLPVKP